MITKELVVIKNTVIVEMVVLNFVKNSNKINNYNNNNKTVVLHHFV